MPGQCQYSVLARRFPGVVSRYREVPCEHCGVSEGGYCVSASGKRTQPHVVRMKAIIAVLRPIVVRKPIG